MLFLELPTGGLSDALGRRPVLIVASLVGLAALGLLYVADSVAMFAGVTLLQGVYRALDSGPLESWYVDTTLAAEPDAGIEKGLSAGATVLSVAIALGALALGRPRGARSVRRHPDPGPADPGRARRSASST